MKFNKFFGICALASGIALAGCGGSQTPAEQPKADAKTDAKAETKTAQTIKVGVMSGPEHKVAEVAAKVAKEKYGLTVE